MYMRFVDIMDAVFTCKDLEKMPTVQVSLSHIHTYTRAHTHSTACVCCIGVRVRARVCNAARCSLLAARCLHRCPISMSSYFSVQVQTPMHILHPEVRILEPDKETLCNEILYQLAERVHDRRILVKPFFQVSHD